MTPDESALRTHQTWLGYAQPVGLVVSPTALLAAQAIIDLSAAAALQQRFAAHVDVVDVERGGDSGPVPEAVVRDVPALLVDVFGWRAGDIVGEANLDGLEVALPEYHDTLRPTFAVPDPDGAAVSSPSSTTAPTGDRRWLMLIDVLPDGTPLDVPLSRDDGRGWDAKPQERFERLLRETGVPIGLLCNGARLRLVYAPRGETSGHITFPVAAMAEVGGRPMLAGLHVLLGAARCFSLPRERRLPAILLSSRRYQNDVSAQLADQVLSALYELVRGFQAADEHSRGALLGSAVRDAPDQVYQGLLTVLLRLVFVLYAEDRGLMPGGDLYANHYGLAGLFDRLRADAGRYPDTMDRRYGAWAQLLALFRIVYDGASHEAFRLPKRHGHLFDPDRFPFLEGRPLGVHRVMGARIEPPLVADGVVFRVLRNLLVLGGERLSFRSLDVEQIGSIYETMMGFSLESARGPSIAVKPSKAHGAPVTINIDDVLDVAGDKRSRWFKEATDRTLPPKAAAAVAAADSALAVVAALGSLVSRMATPDIVPPGAIVLQPSDERRRSGSHYTPRSLTAPIVTTTLRPVLAALGPRPTPAQILDLKVCDPAMGSGAFLVEACRQLGDALKDSWHAHDLVPAIPPDEDEVLFARRQVVQRCLYGVDKNAMAADLAKLSLWLVTLAKDHPFTFLDHALRSGDSLVGLSPAQIQAFDWSPDRLKSDRQATLVEQHLRGSIDEVLRLRARIREAADDVPEAELRDVLTTADAQSARAELVGDVLVAAFFSGAAAKARDARRKELGERVRGWLALAGDAAGDAAGDGTRDAARDAEGGLRAIADELREDGRGVVPFHWELEFPEVFARGNPGFDAIVGNPPFAGNSTVAASLPAAYPDWLKAIHPESHGNADLVAHFYRRAFNLLRDGGAFGLIATNTIAQGDTRSTGLRWLCTHGGTIYAARKRLKWPGQAAVIVSVVHVHKGELPIPYSLDGRIVERITAFLFRAGGHEDPRPLAANAGRSFQGSIVLGMGFTFDDTDVKGVATPIAEMHRLVAKDPRNAERIFPYIGGEEVNDSPTHTHHRYAINFGEMPEVAARKWPELMAIIEEKVRPERLAKDAKKYPRMVHEWWKYWNARPELHQSIEGMDYVLVVPRTSKYLAIVRVKSHAVFSENLIVFAVDAMSFFALLQSQPHGLWVSFTSSTLEDRQGYRPTDCFETFPFPPNYASNPTLESAGRTYYDHRAALMVARNEGLTKTYNRFHDPDEMAEDIVRLRELHAAMDRAVLDAYGWTDVPTACGFEEEHPEDADGGDGEGGGGQAGGKGRAKKKAWRYRWPEGVRDDVLGRLLALNAERAAGEAARGEGKGRAGARRAQGRGKGMEGEGFVGRLV